MGKTVKARKHTNDEKINAAVLYANEGTVSVIARDTGVRYEARDRIVWN